MNLIPRARLAGLLLTVAFWINPLKAQTADRPGSWFSDNPEWAAVETISLAEDGARLVGSGSSGPIFYYTGRKEGAAQLRSRASFGDVVLRLEFMQTAGARTAIYFASRYKLVLDPEAMGEAGPPVEADTVIKADPVPPLVSGSAPPATWQKLEVSFRAPRLDDARNMTVYGMIIEAKVDGRLVQSNTLLKRSKGSEHIYEDSVGQITIGVEKGGFAFRNFSFQRADFEAVRVPRATGQATNVGNLIDFVRDGEQTYRSVGCIECHAVQPNDTSVKSGPNLFGLFTFEARDRSVVTSDGGRFTVKTDRSYLHRSMRAPLGELAIAEKGPTEGKPFLPVMPPYLPATLSDTQIDAIGTYLGTLNEPQHQGPIAVLVERTGPKNYDPMTDRMQLLVDRSVRTQRGPMMGVSGRAIHVGQPNGINYSFDPRVLGLAKIWQGGFLDMAGEWQNRGGRGLKPGFESRELDLGTSAVLFAPLDQRGNPVDFSFKEARFHDLAPVKESLNSPVEHLDRIAEIDAQFLGYTIDSKNPTAVPTFNFRVGRNIIGLRTEIATDGKVRLHLQGELATEQSFVVNTTALALSTVSVGALDNGRWILPVGRYADAMVQGQLTIAADAVWRPSASKFDHLRQPLATEPSKPLLPAGYRAETYLSPKDNYGRELLFEPLGMALAPDGTLVVATRTAGVWRLVGSEWRLFAEGIFDSLGVQVEDERGLQVVVSQKSELTRLTDTNGDGLADKFETLTDAFSYHGNYHAYMHGPVRDANGDYFMALNLDHPSDDIMYKAGGRYMGTSGGYRGWAIRVPAKGGFEPWASGLRSPAGLAFAPDGRLWYAENQGEYVGTSKIFVLKKDAFYGHPSGLVERPGMTPASPEIAWEKVMNEREFAVVLFPHNRVGNAPGNPIWDTTGGRFGPFAGQMFIGDQTRSNLLRVTTEMVEGREQGVAITFANALESGVMRPLFLPDGSLLLGQTGRGWQARGGRVSSLQRLIWDGKTIAPGIHNVSATPTGFSIHLSTAIPATAGDRELNEGLAIKSWLYRDAPDYGSPELDEQIEAISKIEIADDRRTIQVTLAKTEQPQIHPQQTARVYHLALSGKTIWSDNNPGFDAYYSLYKFPAAK